MGSAATLRASWWLLVVLAASMVGAGCDDHKKPAEVSSETYAPYPPAAWRMAPHELGNVALTISHILVVYDGERPELSALRAPGWKAERNTKRSRAAALQRATQIASEAQRRPEKFASLAAKYSDDLATRHHGGSLGTWSAALMFESFLDALATMRPGDVSRVVETEMGFHVLKLRETPKEQLVSAAQIVIGYVDSVQYSLRPGRDVGRTRADAKARAERVAKAARAHPEMFERLVEQYTDHADVLRRGDIGVWSTHRASVFHRELESIANLKMGEVSAPIDSFMGFRVFLRKPVRPRAELAARSLVIPYVSGSKGPRSLEEAKALGGRLHAELKSHPERFPDLQKAHCCQGLEQWSEGRGSPQLENVVVDLHLQGISEPLDRRDHFLIVQRVQPEAQQPEVAIRDQLPTPTKPDIGHWVRNATDSQALANYVGQLSGVVNDLHSELGEGQRQRAQELFARLESGLKTAEDDSEQRMAALEAFRRELREALEPDQVAVLKQAIMKRFIADVAPDLRAINAAR